MWKTSVVVAPASAVHAPAPLKGSLVETVKNAAAIGFEAVQLTVNRPAEFQLTEAQAVLAAHRLRVSSIATGGAYSIDHISLGHQDERIRLAAVDRMRQHIELASQLGGADVVIGLIRGTYADCDTKADYMRQYRKSIAACLAYAERCQIRIVHEAIGRLDSDVLRTIQDNVAFIESFSSPYFKLHIDTYHLALEETDFYAAVLRTKGLLAQVDISDANRTYPDGRHFDFPRLLEALNRINYQGYLVFEYNSTGDGVTETACGLRYIQSLAGQIDGLA